MTATSQPAQVQPGRPLIDVADQLLHEAQTGVRGWWPRAVAWLVRVDIEDQMAERLAREGIDVRELPFATKLLLLRHYAGEEKARDVISAWCGLSAAGHHHAYELAPTQSELVGWLEVAKQRSLSRT